jgi:hypothetical protein
MGTSELVLALAVGFAFVWVLNFIRMTRAADEIKARNGW